MNNVVLDTSILLGISHIYKNNIQQPRSRRDRFLFDIKDMLEDRKITCIVTPTIRDEIKKGWRRDDGFAEKVISRFCEIDKFNKIEEGKALSLADAYGNFPIGDSTAIIRAEHHWQENYFDALIVAEVSVLQKKYNQIIPFITDNIKDVCDEAKINQINNRHGVEKIHIHSMHTLKDAIALAKSNNKTM